MKSEQASTCQGELQHAEGSLHLGLFYSKVGMGVFALEKVVIPIVKINISQLPSPLFNRIALHRWCNGRLVLHRSTRSKRTVK